MPAWNDLLQWMALGTGINASTANIANGNINGTVATTTLISIPANSQWVGSISITGSVVASGTAQQTGNYQLIASSSTVIIGFSSVILELGLLAAGQTTSQPGTDVGTVTQSFVLVTGQTSAHVAYSGNGQASTSASVTACGVLIPRSAG